MLAKGLASQGVDYRKEDAEFTLSPKSLSPKDVREVPRRVQECCRIMVLKVWSEDA